MEFIELMDCIRRLGNIDPPTFACTAPNADGYSFFGYSPKELPIMKGHPASVCARRTTQRNAGHF